MRPLIGQPAPFNPRTPQEIRELQQLIDRSGREYSHATSVEAGKQARKLAFDGREIDRLAAQSQGEYDRALALEGRQIDRLAAQSEREYGRVAAKEGRTIDYLAAQSEKEYQRAQRLTPLQGPQQVIGPINPVPREAIGPREELAARLLPAPPPIGGRPGMPRDLGDVTPPTTIDFPQPSGTRAEALSQLSSDEIDTLVRVAYPGDSAIANAIAAHPDPTDLADAAIQRITVDNHALAALATADDALARKLAYLPEPDEIAAVVSPSARTATEAASAAIPTPAPVQAISADGAQGFADLIASRDDGKMGAYLPNAGFFAKRLGISVEEAQGYIDDLVRRGVVGDERGVLAFRPGAITPRVNPAGNVDIPAVDNAATIARGQAAKADLFGDAADVAATIPTVDEPWNRPLDDLLREGAKRASHLPSPKSPVSGGKTFYHVVPEGYQPGDPLFSAVELKKQRGINVQDKWGDEYPNYLKSPDAKQISLAESYAEAVDVLHSFLDGKGTILAVDVPQGAKIARNGEGYPVINKMIPAEWLREVPKPKALNAAEKAAASPKSLGGDIAAGGGGGGGMGILPFPGGLSGPVGRAVLPAAAGGLSGALAGAGVGAATDDEDRIGGALKGGLIGAGVGYAAGGGASLAGLDTAVKAALPKYVAGSMLDPGMHADGLRQFAKAMDEAKGLTGVPGAGAKLGAANAQWRAQVVNTLKQIPQDALSRAFVMWGIASKEFGASGADLRRWQAGLRQERATGVSNLANPVTQKLRALGLQGKLADLGETYGVDFGGSLDLDPARKQFTAGGRALTGALLGLGSAAKTVNPVAPIYGAIRGYFAPGVDAYIRFINGIQHDAFRFALAEKALDRDVPRLADDFLFELASKGHNVKSLERMGGFFSAADVAAVAGPQAGKDWGALVEALVQGQGDRIAFLGGDFRKSSETGAERAISKIAPFSRWSIRYAPVLAEIALRHPRAALIAGRELNRQQEEAKAQGKKAYQAGITITDKTPLVGLAARARNGGAEGSLTLDPIGALMPYGDLLGKGEELPEDATGYQKVTSAASRVGLSPTPAITAAMYVAGQTPFAPSSLSRTAGLEASVEALPAALRLVGLKSADLPQLRSGRQLLDAGRDLLKPVTGEGAVAASDPVLKRYAELVLELRGTPLSDPRNKDLVLSIGEPDNRLWQLASLQARTSGAATNLTGMISPVQTVGQTKEAAAAQRAGKLPVTDYEISQAPKSQQAGMRAQLDRVIAQNPAIATYRNINPKARRATLLAEFDTKNARLRQVAPALFAERRKLYEESLP
ncbi:MAG: hypothetical protein KBF28_03820 [Gemmatimonadales bacterium]|nr:hypothetical protein [Gemmatimonadales bacterium]